MELMILTDLQLVLLEKNTKIHYTFKIQWISIYSAPMKAAI